MGLTYPPVRGLESSAAQQLGLAPPSIEITASRPECRQAQFDQPLGRGRRRVEVPRTGVRVLEDDLAAEAPIAYVDCPQPLATAKAVEQRAQQTPTQVPGAAAALVQTAGPT